MLKNKIKWLLIDCPTVDSAINHQSTSLWHAGIDRK
uniref:Uncharacterized protein n=1 Tax=Arundo donax TaxID=35708 RepID=A0A0A9FX00_ARUDO